jgi:hypothetical protein
MSECDGCGRPIGHATEIEGEYHSEELDRNHYYFGSRECDILPDLKDGASLTHLLAVSDFFWFPSPSPT